MPEMTFAHHCACGCGDEVSRYGGMVRGHSARLLATLRREAQDYDNPGTRRRALIELYERGWELTPPKRLTRTSFGVEAEFFGMDQWRAVQVLSEAGYHVEDDGYHHDRKPYWRVTEDGSVSGEGCELVSPVLRLSDKSDVAAASGALNELAYAGGQVNRTCGLHVHHNLAGKSAEDVAETVAHWALFQSIINRILPASRWDGEYCAGMNSPGDWYNMVLHRASGASATMVDGMRFGRYHAINLNAINTHGTLEYRQHSGTLNGTKLEHWLVFTRAMHDVSRRGTWTILRDLYGGQRAVLEMGVDGMMRYLGINKVTREFYLNRERQLANIGDDEGANEYPDSYDDAYDDEGGIWCENCDEVHYED